MNINHVKLKRREQKYENILFKDTGIKVVTISQFIMVCNAGLSSGYSEEEIVQIFSTYGSLEKIFMVPTKSYCFLKYTNDLDAKNVISSLHGKILEDAKTVLYLLPIEKVPDTYNPFNANFKPAGLDIYDDYVTEEEEYELMKFANRSKEAAQPENVLKHRQVEHFGYKFCYDFNSVCKNTPLSEEIPSVCNFIINRLKSLHNGIADWLPNQLTINHYEPGQGIPTHVDSHDSFDDIILSLSLGSHIVMEFNDSNKNHLPLLLRRRSLLIMSGESRYMWSHGITSRKYDVVPSNVGLTLHRRGKRISYTFRRIRNGSCKCSYINCCDSRSKDNDSILDEHSAAELERLHVHTVYEKIAEHFSETRQKPWPNVARFINALQPGSVLADIGCANGRFFGINTSVFQIGCDISVGLCSICASKGYQVTVCDCLRLPFRSNCVDACISIAVIHHLSTVERRIKAIREIVRILRPDGKALIYVWAKEQRRINDDTPSTYLKRNFRRNLKINNRKTEKIIDVDNIDNRRANYDNDDIMTTTAKNDDMKKEKKFVFPIHESRTEFKASDIFVEWKLSNNKINNNKKNNTINNNHTFNNKKANIINNNNNNSAAVDDNNNNNNTHNVNNNNNSSKYLRFYHVFQQYELEELCRLSLTRDDEYSISVLNSYYDEGNWCIVLQKTHRI